MLGSQSSCWWLRMPVDVVDDYVLKGVLNLR